MWIYYLSRDLGIPQLKDEVSESRESLAPDAAEDFLREIKNES